LRKRGRANKINGLLKVSKRAVGIDIGCGIGIHAAYFAHLCKKLYTIDVTDNFLDLYNEVVGNVPNITRLVSDNFPMLARIPDPINRLRLFFCGILAP
jgi:ubiquinone/menaquinone biosynthesis C-methylase UbiE